MLKSYKDLIAWQKAYALCVRTYRLTQRFPADERFGLVAQARRSAVSVAANIAEGYGRGTTRDYVRFLWIANGSLAELETHLMLARDLELGEAGVIAESLEALAEVERILAALIRSLEKKGPQ